MSEFEYISVLLSILIGLAITQLLAGIARLVRDGRSLARAWWVILIAATLLLANLEVWWVSYNWRHVAEWTFLSYLASIVLPVLLYIQAYLILPADLHLDGTQLAQEFLRKRRPFFVIMGLIPAASFFQQWMLTGELHFDLDTAVRLLFLALAIPGFLSPRVGVQSALAVGNFLLIVIYISMLFVRMR